MGSSQTKEKRRSMRASEKVVEGLKEKVRLLQEEINEVTSMREMESKAYEREVMAFSFKQWEWRRERKRAKEEAKNLRNQLVEGKKESLSFIPKNPSSDQFIKAQEVLNNRRDETLEKWKQLYFAIKVELDDLIQRTRQEERLWWKMEEELSVKEERIEFLQARLVLMENVEVKREREVDILRQSLRIMSHKRRAAKLQIEKKRPVLQEF